MSREDLNWKGAGVGGSMMAGDIYDREREMCG